jgi:hypothetical protein
MSLERRSGRVQDVLTKVWQPTVEKDAQAWGSLLVVLKNTGLFGGLNRECEVEAG